MNYQKLNNEELCELSSRDDRLAEEMLLTRNKGLIINMAKKYANKGVEMQDLIQIANMAVLEGVKHFDIQKGVKATTYLTYWMNKRLIEEISYHASGFKITRSMIDERNQIAKAYYELKEELDREVSPEEVAETYSFSLVDVYEALSIFSPVLSLDENLGNEDDGCFYDLLPSDDDVQRNYYASEQRENLDKALNELPEEKRYILLATYGYLGEEENLSQVARKLHLPRSRVARLEEQAKLELRERLIGLNAY